jgi:hypothetical protein
MSAAKWKNFTKEQLENMLKESVSYATFAEKMGYSRRGGSSI